MAEGFAGSRVSSLRAVLPADADSISHRRTVIFVDTDLLPARERRYGSLVENEPEAALVAQVSGLALLVYSQLTVFLAQTVDALVRCGVDQNDIGVIAMYRQQIKLIGRKLQHRPDVEILTADRSQGRDKACIIMSLTRSNTEGQVSSLPLDRFCGSLTSRPRQIGDLLKDWRRINVSLTRAKAKLVVFGSRSTVGSSTLDHLQRFFATVDAKGWTYSLPQDAGGDIKPTPTQPKREAKEASASPSPKKLRKGGGALALSGPLSQDILNSL